MFENRGGGEPGFEFFKAGLTISRPVEFLAFSQEGCNGGCDAGVSFNESTVEVRETEEYLDFLDVGRGWPFIYGDDTIGIHRNTIRGNNKSEEGEGRCMELTFLELAGQSIIAEA